MTKMEFLQALLAKLLAYLRIDLDASEVPVLETIAAAAASWVENGIGTPDWTDERVMMLSLAAGADLYDQRGYVVRGNTNAAVRESTRRLMDDMLMQLRYNHD